MPEPDPEPSPTVTGSVTAAIVTYHPDPGEISRVIEKAADQVRHIAIIENSGDSHHQGAMRGVAAAAKTASPHVTVDLVVNESNLGLSKGCNQAISLARSRGSKFVLLLDQDSELRPNAVARLVEAYDAISSVHRLGSISCVNDERYPVDLAPLVVLDRLRETFQTRRPETGHTLKHRLGYEVLTFTNSGTLIPLSVLDTVGGLNEDLFVDAIDYDFSLRLRFDGYHCFLCPQAQIDHKQGSPFRRRLLRREVRLRSYSPARSYLIVKDTIVCARLWISKFPSTVLSFLLFMSVGTVGGLVLLPGHRDRARAVVAGLYDGGHSDVGRTMERPRISAS